MSSERNQITGIDFRDSVISLIRPELQYDGESWRKIRTLGSIACMHGASTDAIRRLAQDGRFSGGQAALGGDFFTTPNEKYKGWSQTEIGRRVLDHMHEMSRPEGFQKAIEYAEAAEVLEACETYEIYENKGVLLSGAVVAFNSSALHPKLEIHEDILDNALELVLPAAPKIEAIEGIYPVDKYAAEALADALQNMHR